MAKRKPIHFMSTSPAGQDRAAGARNVAEKIVWEHRRQRAKSENRRVIKPEPATYRAPWHRALNWSAVAEMASWVMTSLILMYLIAFVFGPFLAKVLK